MLPYNSCGEKLFIVSDLHSLLRNNYTKIKMNFDVTRSLIAVQPCIKENHFS